MRQLSPTACGLGLRPELVPALCERAPVPGLDFLELAPENWMGIGGRRREQLDCIAGKYPLVAHGLSLSIGATEPLDVRFLREVRAFLDDYAIAIYSDHLSTSRDAQGQLYDLLPIPRRLENIAYLADRIAMVQDMTGRRLVLENISRYHEYGGEMPEGEFLAELVRRSSCGLLLDINNAWVNARNHGQDVQAFIRALPAEAIAYHHIAGHLELADGTLLDTHGTPVANEVADLGREVRRLHGDRPLLLERDNFVPALDALLKELRAVSAPLARKPSHAC